MSPKRRYQYSNVQIGLPPPPLPAPEYFANLKYSYNRPITTAEIQVNPCLASRRIPQAPAGSQGACQASTGGRKAGRAREAEKKGNTTTPGTNLGGAAVGGGGGGKGNRTYRVRHHHQNHYELPVVTGAQGESRPSSSLSQGIFGLPVLQDYFHSEETLDSQQAPHNNQVPKPRMKMTLPSFKNFGQASQESQAEQEMDGVIQIRPASRSRTRPELSGGGGLRRQGPGGGGRRRVQSTAGGAGGGGGGARPCSACTVAEEITPTGEPTHEAVEAVLGKLRSQDQDWEEIVEGFKAIQCWTLDHPQSVKGILKKVIWSGLPHLASQRTKLSRAACQCFKTLYETQRRNMEGEGDKVFQRLLDLCGGLHNKFIQEECKVALMAAVQNTDSGKMVTLLEQFGARHKNQNCREAAALLLAKVMEVIGPEKVLGKEYAGRVLPMILGFLREGQLNTRLNGKACLSKVYFHPDFQKKLRRYCAPDAIRNVQDLLKKFETQAKRQGGHF